MGGDAINEEANGILKIVFWKYFKNYAILYLCKKNLQI